MKHVCEREFHARRDMQVAGFQADWAFVFIEPPQEITADRLRAGELERRDNVEIDTVWRIE